MQEKGGWFWKKTPQVSEEVWQVGLFELSWALGQKAGESVDFALALCVEVGSTPLAASMPAPPEERIPLVTGVIEQAVQTSRRYPRRIEVFDLDLVEPLREVLPEKVTVELKEELPDWEAAAAELSAKLSIDTQEISSTPVAPKAIEAFSQAAVRRARTRRR